MRYFGKFQQALPLTERATSRAIGIPITEPRDRKDDILGGVRDEITDHRVQLKGRANCRVLSPRRRAYAMIHPTLPLDIITGRTPPTFLLEMKTTTNRARQATAELPLTATREVVVPRGTRVMIFAEGRWSGRTSRRVGVAGASGREEGSAAEDLHAGGRV
jgi:hypothetical protein